jgi:hypothetical protein
MARCHPFEMHLQCFLLPRNAFKQTIQTTPSLHSPYKKAEGFCISLPRLHYTIPRLIDCLPSRSLTILEALRAPLSASFFNSRHSKTIISQVAWHPYRLSGTTAASCVRGSLVPLLSDPPFRHLVLLFSMFRFCCLVSGFFQCPRFGRKLSLLLFALLQASTVPFHRPGGCSFGGIAIICPMVLLMFFLFLSQTS